MSLSSTSNGKPGKRGFRRFKPGKWLLALGVVLLAAVAVWFFFMRGGEEADPWRTEEVRRGQIVRSVTASGALEALVTVQVGSQLSGQVTQVLVDYNDRVRRGQTLAVLDPQTQRSSVEQSRAAVQSAQASVAQAEANVALAQAEHDRQQFLFERNIIAQAALDSASAQLATARAGLQSARAQVAQQQAQLRSNQANLNRTTITAPIDGVVIDRQIEPGQTVASGLNVAVLFTLAQDLGRVQTLITVDEADIGGVAVGQPVRFTVDAFPNDTFTGRVTQVRMLPNTSSNVVAYTVVAEADNPGEKLMPGMTANAEIIQEERRNVLRAPNAALRFTPPNAQGQQQQRASGGAAFGGPPPGAQRGQGQGANLRGNFTARMVEELNLDAAQRAQVEPILQRAAESMRSAMAGAAQRGGQGGGQGGGARRSGPPPAVAAAFNAAFDEIAPLLRPEQQTALETLRARYASGGGQRGVVWVLRDGAPVQVPVVLGASDGSHTEVTGGGLQEGDRVITGGGPRVVDANAQAAGQRRARMF